MAINQVTNQVINRAISTFYNPQVHKNNIPSKISIINDVKSQMKDISNQKKLNYYQSENTARQIKP